MSTCNRLDLESIGSSTTMPKNFPRHWVTELVWDFSPILTNFSAYISNVHNWVLQNEFSNTLSYWESLLRTPVVQFYFPRPQEWKSQKWAWTQFRKEDQDKNAWKGPKSDSNSVIKGFSSKCCFEQTHRTLKLSTRILKWVRKKRAHAMTFTDSTSDLNPLPVSEPLVRRFPSQKPMTSHRVDIDRKLDQHFQTLHRGFWTRMGTSYWTQRPALHLGFLSYMRLVGKLLLFLGHVDGHHIGQRGHRSLLALGVPVEHDLDLDTQHSLQETRLDLHFIFIWLARIAVI